MRNTPLSDDPALASLRLPPHSLEAEQSLLGGLLIDNTVWDRVGDIVNEVDFYRDDHRRIFSHIRKLIETGRPADVVTVYESIEKSNEVDQTGGLAYLGEIANNTPSAANIRHYAEIIHERAVLRRTDKATGKIYHLKYNPPPEGAVLEHRSDDQEDKVNKRLDDFERVTLDPGQRAEVVYLGIGQLGLQPEKYLVDYWNETVRMVAARRVVLTHWDDFFRPLHEPLRALPYAGDDLDVSMRVLGRLAAEDGLPLHLPTLWQRADPWL